MIQTSVGSKISLFHQRTLRTSCQVVPLTKGSPNTNHTESVICWVTQQKTQLLLIDLCFLIKIYGTWITDSTRKLKEILVSEKLSETSYCQKNWETLALLYINLANTYETSMKIQVHLSSITPGGVEQHASTAPIALQIKEANPQTPNHSKFASNTTKLTQINQIPPQISSTHSISALQQPNPIRD